MRCCLVSLFERSRARIDSVVSFRSAIACPGSGLVHLYRISVLTGGLEPSHADVSVEVIREAIHEEDLYQAS